jgi:hypothetical protein
MRKRNKKFLLIAAPIMGLLFFGVVSLAALFLAYPLLFNPIAWSVAGEDEANANPIVFYGKIQDGNSNPIADAAIDYNVVAPSDRMYVLKGGNPRRNDRALVHSDAQGLFQINHPLGLMLQIDSVSASGFRSFQGGSHKRGEPILGFFNYQKTAYYPDSNSGHFPNPNNPVVYILEREPSP